MRKVKISSLIVTQNRLRDYRQVDKMIAFVKAGGRFTKDARLAQSLLTDSYTARGMPPPMHISIMEDGKMLLHDGHHRAVAMVLGGRDKIEESEYESGNYTYADYTGIYPEKGWFTPFDIDAEVRLPDFGQFKGRAFKVYESSPERLAGFIHANRQDYAEPRRIWTVKSLTEDYKRHGRLRRRMCV